MYNAPYLHGSRTSILPTNCVAITSPHLLKSCPYRGRQDLVWKLLTQFLQLKIKQSQWDSLCSTNKALTTISPPWKQFQLEWAQPLNNHLQEILYYSEWFEPRSISSLYCVIVRVSIVLKRTVVGDWRFDNLSGSHLQSQVSSVCQSMLL